jgi:hypothetical protein
MNLYERARKDIARILSNPNGFSAPVVFTTPSGVEMDPVTWFFIDVNLDINPSTGMPVVARKVAGSVSLYAPDGVTSQFPLGNPVETAGKWKLKFTNGVESEKEYFINKPIYDRTTGMITMTAEMFTKRLIPAPNPEPEGGE